MAAPIQQSTAPAKAVKAEETTAGSTLPLVVVTATVSLRDPHTSLWLNANVPTEAPLTGWLQSQIDAGLIVLEKKAK
jgi:hypothetical protein